MTARFFLPSFSLSFFLSSESPLDRPNLRAHPTHFARGKWRKENGRVIETTEEEEKEKRRKILLLLLHFLP
jgi:hypothetical protein